MKKAWLLVIIGACFEVCWVIGLKHAENITEWTATVICIITSFTSMIAAGRKLPIGTVYAVFVGLGTAGTILTDVIFFREELSMLKALFLFLLLIGIIGLKMATPAAEQEGEH